MGFNPAKGLSNAKALVQRAFTENTNKRTNSYENRMARIVYPYEISPNDNSNNGYILAVAELFGETKHLYITINDEVYQSQKERALENKDKSNYGDQFNGAFIDSKMANKIGFPAENKDGKKIKAIILEGAVFQTGKTKSINGEEFIPVVVRRIHNVKKIKKAIEGWFTASFYHDNEIGANRISSLEYWGETPTPVEFDDEKQISEIKSYLDMITEETQKYKDGSKSVDNNPRLGFKFIASTETYETDPATNEQVLQSRRIIDSSTCLDVVEVASKVYEPINSEQLGSLMEAYKDYVFNGDEESESVVKKLNLDPASILFELVTFKIYRTSSVGSNTGFIIDENRKGIQNSPLYKMITTPYFNSVIGDTPSLGKNHAFLGVVKISPDKRDDVTDELSVRSFATQALFSDIGGNILSALRNAKDGKKYEIEEKIRKRYYTPAQIEEFERRKESKQIETSGASGLQQASSGLTPPSNLSLDKTTQTTEHQPENIENIFGDEQKNDTATESVSTAKPEPTKEPSLDVDDDLPF